MLRRFCSICLSSLLLVASSTASWANRTVDLSRGSVDVPWSSQALSSLSCPSDMVPVMGHSATCIDVYEWPNRKGVKPLLGATGVQTEYDQKANQTFDAETLCARVGKRVCTRSEWTAACVGEGGTRYPWGKKLPKYTPGKDANKVPCNIGKRYMGFSEKKIARRDKVEFERVDQSEPSGSRETCRSASGAYDMVGNVEEWVRCTEAKSGWCLMGRYWADPRDCYHVIDTHHPKWHYYETGFRCCKDLEEENE